ncbi:response regulator transcription factor [Alkalihalobacillus sp. LMS39]|uniref:response regulator n=1 Tax=Alkalihalobacillus sp. LMS39 TaxID=2924032 RepID=UPI001FB3A0A6|nr:response regulator transcription factor [Alkalihalobacillus sp. LMS39]UOE93919.1 response regulator transcription factor [Alkalihalobacillus sp. LMS39]
MTTILLVEDQLLVRQGLKMMLEHYGQMKVIGDVSNGQEAIAFLQKEPVDLVLMDIRMPVMNGLDAAKEMLTLWPTIKIVMLTTFDDDDYIIDALQLGVKGYLLKDTEPEQMIQSIRTCLNGGVLLGEGIANRILPKLQKKQTVPPVIASLTDRELAIVQLVAEGKNNEEISKILHLSIGTVKNHMSHILQKLDLRDRTQLAVFAIKHDLV